MQRLGPAAAVHSAYDNGPGDHDDVEREQMIDDVPTLPVVAIEPNPFNGQRPHLGYSNLLKSYMAGGEGV